MKFMKLILIAVAVFIGAVIAKKQIASAQVQTCVRPNYCVAQYQPCVWPYTCGSLLPKA